ncbi:MAG: amidohydrolase [Acetomicrobium sp.]|nr:amidohydrolase [Acetomicrobium sp.]
MGFEMTFLKSLNKEIEELKDELIELRRDFHMYPELGFKEVRTSERVAEYLKRLGLEVREKIAHTGVVTILEGKEEGKTVMLRSDMDALPVEEQNKVPYRSRSEGIMHACGHDGHMAMLLVAAKILSRHKEEIPGKVMFLFQPNEEVAGARQMIEEGALDDPHPDGAFAIHLWTPIESGKMGISAGPVMAALDEFKVRIKGRGGHTGAPHTAIDPVLTAADFIQSVQMIQTREIDVLKPTLIMFGLVNAGTATNVIPEHIDLGGTIRYLYEGGSESPEKPLVRFERILKKVCEAHQCTYELEFIPSNSTLINDDKMANLVSSVAKDVVGAENITSYIGTAGEDFAEFAKIIPSCFYFVGAGNPKKGIIYPHHHPLFDIDEDVLPIGVEMHIRTAIAFLRKE